MKKIPTIFEREFTGPREFHLTGKIAPGMENILYQATATVKIDGSCCAIIGGTLYKRFDAKPGKMQSNAVNQTQSQDIGPTGSK